MHWVHATAFCILLGSGLFLYLPSLSEAVNRRPLLKHVHLYTAAALAGLLLLIFVLGDRRSLLRTAREVDRLDPRGRMNRGQQLNTIATAAFAILFAVTGFLGCYTTVSSFSLQTLSLAREGEMKRAASNVLLSLFLCLVAVAVGFVTASKLFA